MLGEGARLKVIGDGPPYARLARAPLERCGPGDLFHDYILSPYDPLVDPAGKLRSLNLLIESFALLGVEDEGIAVMERLRRELGAFRTVWGIKQYHGALVPHGWELYFYDFERAHADLSIDSIRGILEPVLRVDGVEPWPLPWHMFSVEFTAAKLREKASCALDVYIDMRSYKVTGADYAFENVYTFHDPRTEIDDVLHRVRSSVHFDPRRDNLARLITPALLQCGRLCVANKRRADALYFSRIPTPTLLEFLRAHRWPEPLAAFVAEHAGDLDHLLWDAGLDFHRGGEGPVIDKTGVYGTF